ncbi:hypothetical protein QQF64_002297 [Cirrhinus molitorella]|uniref:Uncharacterized protein n=1 Tax=Cirrhinus molitorella TaxID=172907 RepID=A0ABR3MPR0_9TELE
MPLWLEVSAKLVSSPALPRESEQHCNNPAVHSKHEASQPTNRASPMCKRMKLRLRSAWKMLSAVQDTGMRVYPKEASSTLEFVQRAFCGINSQTGSKAEKRHKLNAPVCTLLRKLLDFDLMG